MESPTIPGRFILSFDAVFRSGHQGKYHNRVLRDLAMYQDEEAKKAELIRKIERLNDRANHSIDGVELVLQEKCS